MTLLIGPPPLDEASASVLLLVRAPLMGGASICTNLFASATRCCQRLGF